MGCDFYIITAIEGVGETIGGEQVNINIVHKRECGYFILYDSDDKDELNQTQIKRCEKINHVCSDGIWNNDAIHTKYHAIVKDQYPDVHTIHSLTKFRYTHLRT